MEHSARHVRVARKRIEAAGICSYELVDPDGAPLPPFGAGSHIDVHLPNGLVRQYSLCNHPAETSRYLIGVLRDPASRGGSAAMHDLVHEGDLIRIGGPRNHFPLAASGGHAMLLAGGIGITPILAMAEHLASAGAPFEMHYCSRSRDRTAFHDRLKSSSFASRVAFHFDDGDAAQKIDLPALLASPGGERHLYACGPAGFLEFVLATARAQGWPQESIHFEYFAAPAQDTDGDTAFDVRIASTGKVYRIAADRSVAAALAEQGVVIEVSCEQGVCGTCLTRVLDGEPDHRDQYLTEAERARNDQFTPCCSRAKSQLLVLDL
ncbi:PDR/VanB family oxidoreductase [Methylibium sp.]|uniref:PDR/VanB family oxidoreductase n=1 Tax=Methylibium sp. TaxID=2067992 RepID=UPI003D110466